MCGCVGQMNFSLLVVDDIKLSSPDDKICEWNCVGDVIVLIPGNKYRCTQTHVDEAGNDPDGILIA